MEIIEKTYLDAWKKALKYIIDFGTDFTDKDGRVCREVINMTVTIEDADADYEAPIDIMQQFEWIYPTKEELSSIILNREELATYQFSYGPRIFNYQKNKDQINDFIIPLLKKDPATRRAVVSLYNPTTDSNVLSKEIPSIMFMHFKLKNNQLNLTCFIRSNDFFIGWPGNIYQIFMLHRYVADKLLVKMGSLTTMSCSAHAFSEHFEMINKVLQK
jgi:thymidylate synthase